jgi:thioredoxin-related protein
LARLKNGLVRGLDMSLESLGFLWTAGSPRFTLPATMKSIKITSTLCAAIMALHGSVFAGGEGWSADYAASKKLAAESKKDMLLDFTGSDWCGWCIKLNDEVFKHEPFKAGVKDTFVLVELDYPKDKSKLSEETQKQNAELGEKYAVQGYPSILLCDSEGRPYAATGYQKGGPEKYVEHLNELRENKTKRDEAFAAASKAEGPAKAKALVAALDAMKLEDGMVANFYGDIADQIKAADPKDESGFGKKAAGKKRMADFQNNLQELAANQDMDGALALVDKTIKEGGFETEETLQMMMTRAVIFAQQEKFDEALKAVDDAKAFAPDSPMIPGIDGFRKRIEEGKAKAAEAPAKEEAKEEPAAAE